MEFLGQRKHAFEMLIALAIFPSPKMCQLVMNERTCFLKEVMYFYGWGRGATSVRGESEAYLRLGWISKFLNFTRISEFHLNFWSLHLASRQDERGSFQSENTCLILNRTGIPGKWKLTEPQGIAYLMNEPKIRLENSCFFLIKLIGVTWSLFS